MSKQEIILPTETNEVVEKEIKREDYPSDEHCAFALYMQSIDQFGWNSSDYGQYKVRVDSEGYVHSGEYRHPLEIKAW